jgi:hypothetical protein
MYNLQAIVAIFVLKQMVANHGPFSWNINFATLKVLRWNLPIEWIIKELIQE